ncbi:VOC family protein [Williamsia sp. D3]|uniref:VOC family protein n=1 Tax=Williamsia sp. D3 TaxID=1313067 RepID=UPI0003D37AD9|nr:VOC family protein [Williamsia sp. D3]ETD33199.1 2,3-dihydroxybiphenyl 1,2-dioxygenase [Williamsia sp. D3]
MTVPAHTPHADLHSGDGARPGDPGDRAAAPVVKVVDLAWLEFEKPNIAQAERFAHDFGFTTVSRTADQLSLRGTWSGAPCVLIRRSHRSKFIGPAFRASDRDDLLRLSRETGRRVYPLGDLGGAAIDLTDPSGMPIRVVAGMTDLPSLPDQDSLTFNFSGKVERVNAIQRPPREPARVQRLGHVVIETPRFRENLAWYQEMLGLIVSDFLFFPGQRDRGPTMAFMRCDRGGEPADHHSLAMTLGPMSRYVHSAYQVADLDAVAAGGAYLADRGYHHAWGIGRHIQGSQLFDYWRDPDRFMVEHFADGDMFDSTIQAGWAPMTASGLSQWGPPVTRDFLGASPDPDLVKGMLAGLRNDNEFDIHRLLGLLKVARS